MIKVGNINQYKPLQYIDNKYILSWGLKQHGKFEYSWNYEIFTIKPTIEIIKKTINTYYNNITKNNIENKFYWNNMNILLTLENQIDYKLLFDTTVLLNGSNLPEKVKFKIGTDNIYYSFEEIDDMKDFIIEMNNHIRKYLNKGYDIKDSINYEEYKEYLETIK